MALHWLSSLEDDVVEAQRLNARRAATPPSAALVEPSRDRGPGRSRIRARAWWLAAAAVALLGLAPLADARPSPQRHPRVQNGYATYYAASFHGDETASGETFDRRKMIAAHRSLPFDTRVRVRNLENGRTVDVRIVDRGPYGQNWREGTIIDLSRAAATRLRMVEDGQVRVRVTVLRLGDGRRVS